MAKASTERAACVRCGRPRTDHPDGCPIDGPMLGALIAFRDRAGGKWKMRLRAEWDAGTPDPQLARALRVIGPDGLAKVRLARPERPA